MLKEITIALQSWDAARLFIKNNKLFKWIIIPGIVYTILLVLAMYLFSISANSVVDWISYKTGILSWLQKDRTSFTSFIFVMTGMMFWLTLLMFYFSIFKYIILIIGAPVFAYLSEKTEAIVQGQPYSLNNKELLKICTRNIKLSLRNLGWQSVYMLALVFLSLMPVVGWITPVIILLLEAYYFGLSMLDYSYARAGFSLTQSISFTAQHKGLAIGNGLMFFLMHLLVFLAPAYAIVAATLCVHKIKEN